MCMCGVTLGEIIGIILGIANILINMWAFFISILYRVNEYIQIFIPFISIILILVLLLGWYFICRRFEGIKKFTIAYWPPALLVVIGLFIIAYMFQLSLTNPTAYDKSAALLIAGLATVASWILIWFASRSLRNSERSLELTRNTTRPFLTNFYLTDQPDEPKVIVNSVNPPPRVLLHVKNTGVLPANKVKISCFLESFSDPSIDNKLEHSSSDAPAIYFPGDLIGHTYYLINEQVNHCRQSEYTIRVLIEYQNKISGKACFTNRFFVYDSLGKTGSSAQPRNITHDNDSWT